MQPEVKVCDVKVGNEFLFDVDGNRYLRIDTPAYINWEEVENVSLIPRNKVIIVLDLTTFVLRAFHPSTIVTDLGFVFQ